MPRGLSAPIKTELALTALAAPIYCLRITRGPSDLFRWSERDITFDDGGGAIAYTARVMSISGMDFSPDEAGPIQLTLANVDGAITTADRAKSFLGSKVEILAYLPGITTYYIVWAGWADQFSEITQESAILPAYPSVSAPAVQVPKRIVGLACTHEFGNIANWVSVTDFDGSECPYQRVSTIGFYSALQGGLDATTTPVTFNAVWPAGFVTDGGKFQHGDVILIGTEKMLITNNPADPDGGNAQSLTVTRGYRSTTMAVHSDNDTIFYANCSYSVAACTRRGMYGNNSADLYLTTHKRNYFGGFPFVTGFQYGTYRSKTGDKPKPLRLVFSGNESAYGRNLPLVYGRVRLNDAVLLLAKPEGDFLTTMWAIAEGTLATTSTNESQATPANAYVNGENGLFVNGVSRHDLRPGFGIEVFNGVQDAPEPSSVLITGITDFTTNNLGFWGTARAILRINTKSNPSVDVSSQQVTGAFEIQYGRIVRVYSDSVTYTRKASPHPVWALMDLMTSKRAGGGLDHSRLNIQSFVDAAAHCTELITSTFDATAVGRWTFNGVIDQRNAYQEWVHRVCSGMYCLPPFLDKDGKLKIKVLKAETLSGLPIFSSKVATVARNIVWENGRSTLTKMRRQLNEIPNEIQVNFIDKSDYAKVSVVIVDREEQGEIGRKVGDQTRRAITRTLDLPGTTTLDEASRIATLHLRAGEFAKGGLSNNLRVTFRASYRDAEDIELGDIIELEDDLLNPALGEQYFRVVGITAEPIPVEGGGFIFGREIDAVLHANAIYDDTSLTVSKFDRIDAPGAYDAEPPAVTGFGITEAGALDGNGNPVSRLTINFTEPSPLGNYRSLTLWRSNDDGMGAAVGDWRFIGEVLEPGETIEVENTGTLQWFTGVSRALSGHVPDTETKTAAGTYKYPRVQILVDGYTDTSTAEAPVIGIVKSQGQWGEARFEMTVGVDVPVIAPTFWRTVYQTEIEITTDATFATFPAGESLHSIYNWTPPNSIEFATNTVGTYYARARVYNVTGPGAWSSTIIRSTSMLDSGADTDLIAATTPTIANTSGTEFDLQFTIPTGQTSTFYGVSIYGHSSSTLPTATTQETGTAGAVTAGISKLTDATKAWGVNVWVGKDVVLFDTHRNVSPTFDYEAMFIVCEILSNTATEITFNAPTSQVRRTMSGMSYYVVNRGVGHHFWEKLTFTTPVIVDEAITAADPSDVPGTADRSYHMSASIADLYIWITLYNALGQGEITASPAHWTYGGTATGEIDFLDISDGRDIGSVIAGRSLLASSESGYVHIQPNTISGFAQYADPTTGGFTSMDPGHFNVRDYLAIGDGSVDDTVAIQRAIDAASLVCGVVFFPDGRWKFSTLTITAGVTLKGVGWKTTVNAAKGDSAWTTLSNHGGTVLYSTSSSGTAITIVGTGVFPVHLRDLMLVCSGSTVTGIALGSASYSKVQCHWFNVLVANCDLGYNFTFVEDSTFNSLRSRGNTSGFELGGDTNQNVFTNTEVQISTVKGIYVHDCGSNLFKGILIQACTDGDGIHVANAGSTINCFEDIWCENNNSGFDNAINVQGGEKSIFKRVRLGSQYDDINVASGAVNTIFEAVRNLGNATWVNDGHSTCFIKAGGGDPGNFTDTGDDTFYIQDPDISNSNKLKTPSLEVTGTSLLTGAVTASSTINSQTINTPASLVIEKLILTSSIADQSVMTEYTNSADGRTALIGLGPNDSGAVRITPDTATDPVNIVGGLTVGSGISGSSPGDGVINAEIDVQLNGSSYSNPDYVLEHFYTGEIVKFANNPGASDYPGLPSLEEIERHTEKNLQLPRVAALAGQSIVRRTDVALEKLEEIFLHLIQIEKRLKKLEG